jgi:hypothetical protein
MLFTVFYFYDIKRLVLLRGLERTHTFLVPIINPPFADNSPPLAVSKKCEIYPEQDWLNILKKEIF